MKILALAAICAAGLMLNTGCKSCASCSKPAVAACNGSCCSDAAACAKCCKDGAGCAKCCHKS